jgi:1-deoxy-D-xylulose-5-phosphate synthase
VETGDTVPKEKTYSKIFGEKILELAEKDEDIILISAAMIKGIEAVEFFDKFSERAYDVGIAEEHAVTFAGGLAIGGKKPYVAIYSTFLQRAYDQLIHDIAIQNLPVRFIVDRAGIVGEDGKTHQGVFDLSYFLSIPNFTLIAPTTCSEFKKALDYSRVHHKGPMAIRIPRETCFDMLEMPFEFGKWNEIRRGDKTLMIAAGSMLENILEIEERMVESGIRPTIVAAAFLNPLDENYLVENTDGYENVFILEEAYEKNSFGTHVIDFLNSKGIQKRVYKIGIEKAFVEHGARTELLEELGLKGESLLDRIERCLNCGK